MTYLSSFWTSTNSTSIATCSGSFMFQGPSIGTIYRVHDSLGNHAYMDLWMTIYVFGDWTSSDLLKINGFQFTGPIRQVSTNGLCAGMSQKYGIMEAQIQYAHTSSILNLTIQSTLSNGRGYAIRDVTFVLRTLFVTEVQCLRLEPTLSSTSQSVCKGTCSQAHYYRSTSGSCLECPCVSCVSSYCARCPSKKFLSSNFFSTVCTACAANCYSCIDIAKNCLSCDQGYYHHFDNTCTATCPFQNSPNIYYGKDCFFPCNSTSSYYNGVCIATCPTGFVQNSLKGSNYCSQMCTTDQFYYNQTCLAQCIPPLFATVDNSTLISICVKLECPADYNLLPDGTCEMICPNGTILNTTYRSNPTCDGLCNILQYYENGTCKYYCYPPFFASLDLISHDLLCRLCNGTDGFLPDLTCTPSCPANTINETINGNVYCNGPCPASEYFFNKTCVQTCPEPYHGYSDPESHVLICTVCEGEFNYSLADFSCVSECPPGLQVYQEDDDEYCLGKCQYDSNLYLYQNGSCLIECLNQFYSFIDPYTKELKCNLCESIELGLLPNYTCVSSCPLSTRNHSIFGYTLCEPLCPLGEFIIKNGSCVRNCSFPWLSSWDSDGINQLCYLCPGNLGILPNGTCVNNCPYNTRNISKDGETYCRPLCTEGTYLYKNGSCLTTCLKPFSFYRDEWNNYCSICNSTQKILPNFTCAANCPRNYTIENLYRELYCSCSDPFFLYRDGSCLSNCNFPFSETHSTDKKTQLCSICPYSETLQTDLTCSNASCLSSQSLFFIHGEKICVGSCPIGQYLYASNCYEKCPLGIVSFINHTRLTLSCKMLVEIVSIRQVGESLNVSIYFNVSIWFENLPKNTITLLFSESEIVPIFNIIQEYPQNWTIQILNTDIQATLNLKILFSDKILLTDDNIPFSFSNNVSIVLNHSFIELFPIPTAVISAFQGFSTSSMGVAAASAMVAGSTVGFKGQISMVQYLMSLLFLNVNYPKNLMDFLQIFKVARMEFVPNPFEWIFGDLERFATNSPFKFVSNQFTGLFLQNIGNILLICSVFFILHFMGLILLRLGFSSKFKINIKKIIAEVGIPGMMSFLFGFSVVVTVSSTLQIINPDFKELVCILSWFMSILMISLLIFSAIKIFRLVSKMKSNSNIIEEVIIINQNLFRDLKVDKKGMPNPYLGIVLIRDLIQFALIVVLYEFPFYQVLSQLVCAFYLFIAALVMRPYQLKAQNFMDLTRELSLSVIYIFILAIRSHQDEKDILGLFCVMFCALLVVSQLLGSVVVLVLLLISKKKQKIKSKIKNGPRQKRILRRKFVLTIQNSKNDP